MWEFRESQPSCAAVMGCEGEGKKGHEGGDGSAHAIAMGGEMKESQRCIYMSRCHHVEVTLLFFRLGLL